MVCSVRGAVRSWALVTDCARLINCVPRTACALAACCVLTLGLLVTSCSDPRGRPVPPSITFAMTSGQVVASPSTLTGTLTVYDVTGIDSVRVALELGNGAHVGDSTYFATDDPFTATIPILWVVPGAVPTHTTVYLIAKARSYIGFTAWDTLRTAVGDTLRE